MKKIYYISSRDMLKGRVGSIMMMQTCAALSNLNNRVTMIAPTYHRPENINHKEIWAYYKLPNNPFKIMMLPTHLKDYYPAVIVRISKFVFHFIYAFKVFYDVLLSKKGSIVLISRDIISTYPYLILLSLIKKYKTPFFIFELHVLVDKPSCFFLLKRMDGIICITENLKERLSKKLKLSDKKFVICRMGVDLKNYCSSSNKDTIRKILNLPVKGGLVVYTGKVSPGMKEIKMIIHVASKIPNLNFVLVGGKKEAVNYWKKYCERLTLSNIIFTGFVSPSQVIKFQLVADILIMYYPGDWPIKEDFSPSKMMEYMATGNPMISVNFTVIQEVLKNGKNAYLVEPDRPDLLIRAIDHLYINKLLAVSLSKQAKRDVKKYTWENRAKLIMIFVENLYRQNFVTSDKKN